MKRYISLNSIVWVSWAMTKNEFLVTPFHADTWLIYEGERYWAVSCDFVECLYALLPERDIKGEHYTMNDARWVRCESVTLAKLAEVIPFKRKLV